MAHGLLHLLGHDHELGDEAHDAMAAAEASLMSHLGWKVTTSPLLSSPLLSSTFSSRNKDGLLGIRLGHNMACYIMRWKHCENNYPEFSQKIPRVACSFALLQDSPQYNSWLQAGECAS